MQEMYLWEKHSGTRRTFSKAHPGKILSASGEVLICDSRKLQMFSELLFPNTRHWAIVRGSDGEHAVMNDNRVSHGTHGLPLSHHHESQDASYVSRHAARCVAFVGLERVDAGAVLSESERNNHFARPPAAAGPRLQ